jgi:hypothetical protein
MSASALQQLMVVSGVPSPTGMSKGTDALSDAYAKLDWATRHHEQMNALFSDYAKPGGGDERPVGIRFHTRAKPPGSVIASFIVEEPMPREMALLAGDLVHNARTALDHVLARLKDEFGGNAGRGSFPICASEQDWQARVVNARNSSLKGLEQKAIDLIYAAQPLHAQSPNEDPLLLLNGLDNDDKHRLLRPAFVYTGEDTGLDLIEVKRPSRVMKRMNAWTAGQPLEDGTPLARFLLRGDPSQAIGARSDAKIGFATGDVTRPRTSYTALIDRARGIVDKAALLIG